MSTLVRWRWSVAVVATALLAGRAISGLADDCTWFCQDWTACNGITQNCPPCDPGLGVACSDYQAIEYNPSNNVLKNRVAGGNEQAVFQDQRICLRTASCDWSAIIPTGVCISGVSCTIVVPGVTYCKTCTQSTGWTNSNVNDFHCQSCPG